MKYSFPCGDTVKSVSIDDEWLKKTKIDLDISTQEAIDLWLFDHGYAENDTVNELTAKAKKSGSMRVMSEGGKTARKNNRKPDEIKRMLIAGLVEYISSVDGVESPQVLNIERVISFAIGDDKYELTLSKKRKPKIA